MQGLLAKLLRGGGSSSAALSLDFLGATSLDSRITFTRASTATRVNASGLIESVAIDAPRFGYDPVTLAPLGLLIEEQNTNLLLRSDAYGTSPWSTDAGTTTVTANATTAPDGLMTADLVLDGTATNDHARYQVCTIAAGGIYTYSAFYKNLDRRYIRHSFSTSGSLTSIYADVDLQTGVIVNSGQVGSGTLASASITAFGNGWYRVSVAGDLGISNTTAYPNFFLRDSATNATTEAEMAYTGSNKGVYAWGAQLETGYFASSYIPTVAAQVTRSSDNALMTGSNFSTWYNATQGAWFAETGKISSGPFDVPCLILVFSDFSNYLTLQANGAFQRYLVTTSAGTQVLFDTQAFSASGTKVAAAYKANDFAYSTQGAAANTDVSGVVPTVTQMQIGGFDTVQFWNGYIRRIRYYNTRLADAQLQALTS